MFAVTSCLASRALRDACAGLDEHFKGILPARFNLKGVVPHAAYLLRINSGLRKSRTGARTLALRHEKELAARKLLAVCTVPELEKV